MRTLAVRTASAPIEMSDPEELVHDSASHQRYGCPMAGNMLNILVLLSSREGGSLLALYSCKCL
jgi:hypothetical protein